MFLEVLNKEEFIAFVLEAHIISQNIFSIQKKIFISFPTKIKNTHTENKKFTVKFIFPPKVAVFTFSEVFKILFLASHNAEK